MANRLQSLIYNFATISISIILLGGYFIIFKNTDIPSLGIGYFLIILGILLIIISVASFYYYKQNGEKIILCASEVEPINTSWWIAYLVRIPFLYSFYRFDY